MTNSYDDFDRIKAKNQQYINKVLDKYPIIISSNLMKKGKIPNYNIRWVDEQVEIMRHKGYSCALLELTNEGGRIEMLLARSGDKDEKRKYVLDKLQSIKIDMEWKL